MRPFATLPLLTFLWLFVCLAPAHAVTISLCADVWCPYNCQPASDRPGFAVEIVREVFAQAGYGVDYQTVSWARCIDDARSGRFDGIIGAIPTDALDFTYPSQSIGLSSNGFAYRRGESFHYTGPGSLEGHVLGVVRGYAFNGALGAYIEAHRLDTSRIEFVSGNGALIKNLEKLAAGRVDLVLDDSNVLRTTIGNLGLSRQLTLDDVHDGEPVFIGFSPRARHPSMLARIFDGGILRLRESGRVAAILAKYKVADWAH
jgi:polar amino acid transport system substrate-binding protein